MGFFDFCHAHPIVTVLVVWLICASIIKIVRGHGPGDES